MKYVTAIALGISTCMAGPALAATVTATSGLAPQFAKWRVPVYASHVLSTHTWAPASYDVETSDSPSAAIAWFQKRLGSRAMVNRGTGLVRQLAVDGGSYVINVEKTRDGASINVIKNI